jgi:hypothetical protein
VPPSLIPSPSRPKWPQPKNWQPTSPTIYKPAPFLSSFPSLTLNRIRPFQSAAEPQSRSPRSLTNLTRSATRRRRPSPISFVVRHQHGSTTRRRRSPCLSGLIPSFLAILVLSSPRSPCEFAFHPFYPPPLAVLLIVWSSSLLCWVAVFFGPGLRLRR